MKKLLIALAAALVTVASYGQGVGTVVFGNLGGGVNAPVKYGDTGHGPGPDYTAGLYLQGSTTPLATTPFRPAGTGAQAVLDQYWVTVGSVDVTGVAPGGSATFLVRAWKTSLGSFAAAKATGADFGESGPVTVASLGGGLNPPANLTGLQGFTVTGVVPEPSIIALGVLGASALLLRRRK
jgi:hypothetical protein